LTLTSHPGGTPISSNEISYQEGTLIISLQRQAGIAGTPDCPRGWFCFYDRPSFGYPRGKLSGCNWQNLATWGWQYRVESAQYNFASGSVYYYENNTYLFQTSAADSVRSDASPYRNRATRVYRSC
jgi:hypothetical protein